MAAIWKGSLTFGLVNIPVELKTAVRAVRAKRKSVAASRKPKAKKKTA